MSGSGTASTIERVEARRLLVRLRGSLEDDTVQHLCDDLLPRLREIGPGGELIIDMHELESCSTEARLRLIELQRDIAELSTRTAFVANRPRFRGVALYVAHHSDDTRARAFHFPAQADAWLRRSEGRIESIAAYLERHKRGKPKAPARRSSDELLARVTKLRESSDEEETR
jgi:anti-anti-sigma regulatory factor